MKKVVRNGGLFLWGRDRQEAGIRVLSSRHCGYSAARDPAIGEVNGSEVP